MKTENICFRELAQLKCNIFFPFWEKLLRTKLERRWKTIFLSKTKPRN